MLEFCCDRNQTLQSWSSSVYPSWDDVQYLFVTARELLQVQYILRSRQKALKQSKQVIYWSAKISPIDRRRFDSDETSMRFKGSDYWWPQDPLQNTSVLSAPERAKYPVMTVNDSAIDRALCQITDMRLLLGASTVYDVRKPCDHLSGGSLPATCWRGSDILYDVLRINVPSGSYQPPAGRRVTNVYEATGRLQKMWRCLTLSSNESQVALTDSVIRSANGRCE